MARITQKDLEGLCDVINDALGNERKPYGEPTAKGCNPNPNVYHLDYAYGGVKLVKMMDKGTGVRDIFSGYVTKKELYDEMRAYIEGIRQRSVMPVKSYNHIEWLKDFTEEQIMDEDFAREYLQDLIYDRNDARKYDCSEGTHNLDTVNGTQIAINFLLDIHGGNIV